jgi:uncharacterized protein (TIGR02118 family)
MVKLMFLCRRRNDISHERYTRLLLEGHVPIALEHHPLLRRYVVNIVEQSPQGEDDLDSIGELFFGHLDDFRQRLYDSAESQAVVERDVQRFMGGAYAYATSEHVHKASAPSTVLGVRSPGVKLVCPVKRRPDLTHEQFVDHWLNRHVPLALQHHPGLSKYATNVVDQQLSPDEEPWDGIAELHFASVADLQRGMFDSKDGERVIREDMTRFIGRAGAYRVAEYVQK